VTGGGACRKQGKKQVRFHIGDREKKNPRGEKGGGFGPCKHRSERVQKKNKAVERTLNRTDGEFTVQQRNRYRGKKLNQRGSRTPTGGGEEKTKEKDLNQEKQT